MSCLKKPLTERQNQLRLIERHPEKAAPKERWDALFYDWLKLLCLENSAEHNPPLPDTYTKALPGTPKKKKLLRKRAKAKQNLWHPHEDLFNLSGIFEHIQRVVTDAGNGHAKKSESEEAAAQELCLAGTKPCRQEKP